MALDLLFTKSESGKTITFHSVAGLVFLKADTFSLNSQDITQLLMSCPTYMGIGHLLQES